MAKKNNNIIEINGRRYNATTGALLTGVAAKPIKPIQDIAPAVKTTAQQPAAPVAKKAPTVASIDATRTVHHARAHKPQHGKTLMRQAVTKPAPGFKRQAKAMTPTDLLAKTPTLAVVPKWSFTHTDPKRLARAQRVAQSKLINRFHVVQPSYATASVPMTFQPTQHPTAAVAKPVAATTTARTAGANRSMDIFQRALVHANAHEQPQVEPKSKRALRAERAQQRGAIHRRTVTIVSSAIVVVLLTGFIAYQNKANLTLRVASAEAGFHASLPGYQPNGFAVGGFKYSPGTVAINFASATNGTYKLTQKSSNWDSQTLLDSDVATKNQSYQTLQSGGRIIYIYGNNNASWVNNGILYQVTSNGSLTTNDILHIATSM